jgi:hypothetical protein
MLRLVFILNREANVEQPKLGGRLIKRIEKESPINEFSGQPSENLSDDRFVLKSYYASIDHLMLPDQLAVRGRGPLAPHIWHRRSP